MNMSCENHFKLQNSNSASWLKIQVDSIFIEQPCLRKLNEKSEKIEVYIYIYFFLTNIVIAQT